MNILPMYLNLENNYCIDNSTVAKRIKESTLSQLWSERKTATIDTVIIHHISNPHKEEPFALASIVDILISYEVSAHYLILRDGSCYALVPEEFKAWHAGASLMPFPDRRRDVNQFSIGVELAGCNTLPYTNCQYSSLNNLIKSIKSRHKIDNILGHWMIAGREAVDAGLRDLEKTDPNQSFEWDRVR